MFGRAYLRAFTPELVKSAWEAVGIYPYNPDVIPLDKLAPSETSTTRLTTANAIHSTPVRKVMSAFSYFDESSKGCDHNNNGDDDGDNPFLPTFTPRSRIHILHRSFASDSSTSYLVSVRKMDIFTLIFCDHFFELFTYLFLSLFPAQ